MVRVSFRAFGLLLLATAAGARAEEPPALFTRAEVRVVEGDEPVVGVPIPFDLVTPRTRDIVVSWSASTGSTEPYASRGVDFNVHDGTSTIEAGATRGYAEMQLYGDLEIEPDENLHIYLEAIDGIPIETYEYVPVVIVDDDVADDLPLTARDDRLETRPNVALEFQPAANDSFATEAMGGSARIEMAAPPAHGVAEIIPAEAGQGAHLTRIAYSPGADFHGADRLRYRLCDDAGDCREADALIAVRPLIATLSAPGRTGRAFVTLTGLPAMPSARYRAGALAPLRVVEDFLAIDPTPATPWDGDEGRRWEIREPVSEAWAESTHGLYASARPLAASGAVDVYLGIDLDVDNRPDEDEVVCVAHGAVGAEVRCDATYRVDHNARRNWWVMLHNRRSIGGTVRIESGSVDLGADDGTIAVTGPGRVAGRVDVPLIVSWDDPRLLRGDRHLAFLEIGAGPGDAMPMTPVIVERTADLEEARPLRGARWMTPPIRLGSTAHRGLFVDVPAGATSLRFLAPSLSASWYVARGDVIDPSGVEVPLAPLIDQAVASGESALAVDVTIAGAQLQPGRWYFVPQTHGPIPEPMVVHAEIEALSPLIRPGSYFNPARPGSGLFLYPAATQWVGLWYTYFEDGSPTWYYLQAPAPGADGIWTSRVHRTAWNGTSQTITDVGFAIATPIGPDRFMLTYTVDGATGTQPLQALGRGCPMRDGDRQDYSSTWFNPARSGTGYSVQTWPDYEYFAAFIYDDIGRPRFLAAERAGAGTSTAVLDLQQLRGSCPTCTYAGLPQRFDAGVLLRRLASDTLASVAVDAVYTDGIPGTWSVDEPVQLLGGEGSAQGCEP